MLETGNHMLRANVCDNNFELQKHASFRLLIYLILGNNTMLCLR